MSRRKVSYSHLRVFECKAFAHISKGNRLELNDKSTPCIFVGYSDVAFGFKLWNPVNNKMFRNRDVVFQEDQTVTVLRSLQSLEISSLQTCYHLSSHHKMLHVMMCNKKCQSCMILFQKLRIKRKEIKTRMNRVLSRESNPLNQRQLVLSC